MSASAPSFAGAGYLELLLETVGRVTGAGADGPPQELAAGVLPVLVRHLPAGVAR